MVSECYLGESRLLCSSWGNKFQQGLKKKKKKRRSSRSSKVAQSWWPRARPYVSLDSHPIFRVEKNPPSASVLHTSQSQATAHFVDPLPSHTSTQHSQHLFSGEGKCMSESRRKKLSICAANVVKTLWRRTEVSILNKYFCSYEISFDSLMPTFRRPFSTEQSTQGIFAGIKGITFTAI